MSGVRLTGSSSRIPYVSMELDRENDGSVAVQPGSSYRQPVSTLQNRGPPKNYFVFTLISSIFCVCFGLTAIIQSMKVKKLYRKGEMKKSREASKDAKAWALAAVSFGIFWILAIIAIIVLAITDPPPPL